MSAKMNKAALATLMLATMLTSCESKKDREQRKRTEFFQNYLYDLSGAGIPKDKHFYLVSPGQGCPGCWKLANEIMPLWKPTSDGTMILVGDATHDMGKMPNALFDFKKREWQSTNYFNAYVPVFVYTSNGQVDSTYAFDVYHKEAFLRRENILPPAYDYIEDEGGTYIKQRDTSLGTLKP